MIQVEGDAMIMKVHFYMPERGYCAIKEPEELLKLKIAKPAHIRYRDLVQPRTVDMGYNALQIVAGASEFNACESRVDRSCDGRRVYWRIMGGISRLKLKDKGFKPG